MLSAVLQGGLIRVGISEHSRRSGSDIGMSYLKSIIGRELGENPHEIDGLFAIVQGSETALEPYQLNDAAATNVMIMRWNERHGREAMTSGIELFLEDLKRQRQ